MIRLLMAEKHWRGIVYGSLPKSYAPGRLRSDSRVFTRGDSGCQNQVPVDNRNLCRIDYPVAKTTTDFYLYLKPNPHWWQHPPEYSRQQSAGTFTSSADRLVCSEHELSGAAVFISSSKARSKENVVHMMAEMNQ